MVLLFPRTLMLKHVYRNLTLRLPGLGVLPLPLDPLSAPLCAWETAYGLLCPLASGWVQPMGAPADERVGEESSRGVDSCSLRPELLLGILLPGLSLHPHAGEREAPAGFHHILPAPLNNRPLFTPSTMYSIVQYIFTLSRQMTEWKSASC